MRGAVKVRSASTHPASCVGRGMSWWLVVLGGDEVSHVTISEVIHRNA